MRIRLRRKKKQDKEVTQSVLREELSHFMKREDLDEALRNISEIERKRDIWNKLPIRLKKKVLLYRKAQIDEKR